MKLHHVGSFLLTRKKYSVIMSAAQIVDLQQGRLPIPYSHCYPRFLVHFKRNRHCSVCQNMQSI
ncbi:hypothetical protein PAHAL_5G210100 [Panicum hallii]|uniref:Uncharacterized protein n=1 Tax=Panicum hallii TaxID=206008 RepID=A0A2S3HT46_9POAL|nr:hypothetical protein PAHAL_5G210100 [Panicum hallii]